MRYGVNVDSGKTFGDPSYLERALAFIQRLGFDFAELGVEGLEVINGGVLIRERVEEVVEILSHFSLSYVVHGPDALNLASLVGHKLEKKVVHATIDVAATIGSPLVVLHAGYVPNEWVYRYPPVVDEARVLFIEALRGLSAYAEKQGVVLCVENLPPYLDRYLFGDRVDLLVSVVREVGRDNVKICFDFGHGYSAAEYYGFDFLQALRQAEPYISHVHLNDTFGRRMHQRLPQGVEMPQRSELVYGLLHHLPLGWGDVPYREGLRLLKGTDISITLEVYARYERYYARDLAEIKLIIEEG